MIIDQFDKYVTIAEIDLLKKKRMIQYQYKSVGSASWSRAAGKSWWPEGLKCLFYVYCADDNYWPEKNNNNGRYPESEKFDIIGLDWQGIAAVEGILEIQFELLME